MCTIEELKKFTNEELFIKFEKDSQEKVLKAIVEKNIFIAEIISKKFINRGIEYDDLFQVACLGIIQAAKRFEVSRGIKFSSFATPTIIGEIKRYFRDKGNVIRIPRRIYEMSQKIKASREELTHKYGGDPKVEDIAEHLNVSEEIILEALEAYNVNYLQSLDKNITNESETSFEEILGFEDVEFEKIENRDYIIKSIKELSEIEENFIKNRFIYKKTQSEIAKELGVSQMYISRMEKKVLHKLKKNYLLQ